MSHFAEALHPDDLDERHKGDLIEDDARAPEDEGEDDDERN